MERSQFTFYRSYYEAILALPKRDQTAVLLSICAYALDEKEPDLSGAPLAVFRLVKPTLDASRRKAENGKRGGKRKQTGSKTEANRKQTGSEKEGEKENEVENEKEYEIENECYKESLPPDGGRDKKAAAAAVQADYLNRVNASASPFSLDKLAVFADELGPEVCKRAFDIALDAKKTDFRYIEAILQSWVKKGVRCLADIEAVDKGPERTPRNGKVPYGSAGTAPLGDMEQEALRRMLGGSA